MQTNPEYGKTLYAQTTQTATLPPQREDRQWDTDREIPRPQYCSIPDIHEINIDQRETTNPRTRARRIIEIRREGERWGNIDRQNALNRTREVTQPYTGRTPRRPASATRNNPPQAPHYPVHPGHARTEGVNPTYQPTRQRAGFSDGGTSDSNTQIPETMNYDGKSNWKAFHNKFSRFAEANQWNPQECIDNLCWALEGTASEYFTLLMENNSHMSYKDLVQSFERRFGFRGLSETDLVQFSKAR